MANEIPAAGMALVPYREAVDYLFPGFQWLVRNIQYFDPAVWTSHLFESFIQALNRAAVNQLAYETQALGNRVAAGAADHIRDIAARALENSQWILRETGSSVVSVSANVGQGIAEVYRGLGNYYSALGPRQAIARPETPALTQGQGSPTGATSESFSINLNLPSSGEFISKLFAPGGAGQRNCANWLLPLILGLYNTTSGGAQISTSGNNASKRKAPASTTPANKRRRGGARSKDRA